MPRLLSTEERARKDGQRGADALGGIADRREREIYFNGEEVSS